MEEILKLVCMHWVKYLAYIEKGGDPEKAKGVHDSFLKNIRQYLDVSSIAYSDEPSKIKVSEDLSLFSYCSEDENAELFFPEEVGEFYKLYCVCYKGCCTVLYGTANGC